MIGLKPARPAAHNAPPAIAPEYSPARRFPPARVQPGMVAAQVLVSGISSSIRRLVVPESELLKVQTRFVLANSLWRFSDG